MLVLLAAPLAMVGLLKAQSPLRPAAAQKLEGLWICTYVTDNIPGAPPITNYGVGIYSSDGLVTSMVTSATPAVPAIQNLGNQIVHTSKTGNYLWRFIGRNMDDLRNIQIERETVFGTNCNCRKVFVQIVGFASGIGPV